jgi:hypothetical protein
MLLIAMFPGGCHHKLKEWLDDSIKTDNRKGPALLRASPCYVTRRCLAHGTPPCFRHRH